MRDRRRARAARRPGRGQAAADHLGDDRLDRRPRASATKPAPFGQALVELAETPARDRRHDRRPRASTPTCTSSPQAYPDRFYQMGMAEQLLMGAAAGMAREGFMPFATTYAVFASRRAYDFIHHGDRRGEPQRQDRAAPCPA